MYFLRTEKAQKWLKEGASFRKLLSQTLATRDCGGIEESDIQKLRYAFGKTNTGLTIGDWHGRQEAKRYLLRARFRAGILADAELLDEREDLPEPDGEGRGKSSTMLSISVIFWNLLGFHPFCLLFHYTLTVSSPPCSVST